MPNHLHGIIIIHPVGATLVVAPDEGIPDAVWPDDTTLVVAPDEGIPDAVASDHATLVVAPDEGIPGAVASDDATLVVAPDEGIPGAGADHAVGPGARTPGAGTSPVPTRELNVETGRRWALGDIVGAFKSITTRDYGQGVKQCGWPPFPGRLWQRNYYEHIIRGDASLQRIRDYIRNNPATWTEDRENPAFHDH